MTAQRAPVMDRPAAIIVPFPKAEDGLAPAHEAIFATVVEWLTALDGESGLAVVSGGPGSGKTRLLGEIVTRLAGDEERRIGVIPDDGERRSDAHLLRAAIAAFGRNPTGRTGLELTAELRGNLAAHRDDPLPPVLLIDNAALAGSQLEILRAILSAGEDTPRLQVVLFGPPELPDRIARRHSLAGLTRVVAPIPDLDGEDADPAPDTVVQTRLALPGLDEAPAGRGRRGR